MKFIFEVTIKPGYSAEQYARAWLEASAIIQQAPGARGTYLHRKIGEPDKLLAIAHWESKAQRDRQEGERDERVAAILAREAQYVDIAIIGEFEEPEWQVLAEA